MKNFSRFFSWLLVLSLVLSLCPAVFAVGETVQSAYYGIDTNLGMIGQIQPGTDEETLLSRLLTPEGATLEGGVKTGSALTLADGTMLTLVVQGDCNGDGAFTLTDMLQVKALLLEKTEFSTVQYLAADVNADGNVSITDFLQMKGNLLGKITFPHQALVGTEVADTVLMTPGQTMEFGSAEGAAQIEGTAITWEAGIITAVDLGTARITCGDFSTLVTVCQEAPTIAFKQETIGTGPGGSIQLETVTNHPVKQQIFYSVADETIATVDENGVLTAHAEGSTTVTAQLSNGASATQTLTVFPLIESVSLSIPYTMKVKIGGTKQITATTAPEASQEKLIWTSSDTSIATVDQNGVVSGIQAGNVTITCTTEYGKVQASMELKICNLVQVALTFDDGPSGTYTPQLLDLLNKYDVTATFFLVGQMMSYNPQVVTRIGEEGHELGYHTWAHTYFYNMSTQQIKDDFAKFSNMMTELCGHGPTVYRAPGGGINDRALQNIPIPHIYWSVDTRDWETRNTDKVCRAILNGLRDGAIILLHDIHGTTLSGTRDALEIIFDNDMDVEFLTVTELLSRNGTAPSPGKTYYNG